MGAFDGLRSSRPDRDVHQVNLDTSRPESTSARASITRTRVGNGFHTTMITGLGMVAGEGRHRGRAAMLGQPTYFLSRVVGVHLQVPSAPAYRDRRSCSPSTEMLRKAKVVGKFVGSSARARRNSRCRARHHRQHGARVRRHHGIPVDEALLPYLIATAGPRTGRRHARLLPGAADVRHPKKGNAITARCSSWTWPR